MKVLVLNGPNLGRLGRRQPEIYGTTTHGELAGMCAELGARARAGGRGPADRPRGRAARLAQPGGRRGPHPGGAQRGGLDPLLAGPLRRVAPLEAPLVEVHISDPKQRPEEFRHHSVVEPHAVTTIAGQGIDGYRQALEALAARS